MATKSTNSAGGEPAQDDDNVVERTNGHHAELLEFLGDEFLADYFAAGGQATDPVLRRLYDIE